jgi:hypothetical protein
MRVFSVEMLVKEEGAAVVQTALNRLKAETQAVAAEMKATSQAVTNTGAAMQTAAGKTQIAGDRAAKAAIGFAAVGNSLARTGSLTADAGTRIIEAGSQISMMFGPTGLVVAALLGFAAAAATSFSRAKDEAKKMVEDTQKAIRGMVTAGDIAQIDKRLTEVRDGLLDIPSGKLLGGLDDLRAGLNTATTSLANLERQAASLNETTNKSGLLSPQQTQLLRQVREQTQAIEEYRKKIAALEAEERLLVRGRQLAAGYQTPIATRGGAAPAAPVTGGFAGALSAPSTTITPAPAFDLSKIQAAIPQATGIVLDSSNKAAQDMANQMRTTFQDSVGAALVGGIVAGIEQAVASGSIGEGFRALGSMMLAGLGDAMIRFGMASEAFAGLMQTIMTSLGNLLPGGALAASIAMIGIGAALKGTARGMFGKQGGGAAFSVGSFGGGGGGLAGSLPTTQLIFGQTSATTAAGMTPRQSNNITIIGPNDPSAQRAIQELLSKADSRGRVG